MIRARPHIIAPRAQIRPPRTRGVSLPAPIRGWNAITPLAEMRPDEAILLENWFPQPGWCEIRGGFASHCDTSETVAVETLMPYYGTTSTTDKLFAASNATIYDVTTATKSSAVASLTNARFQYTLFTTTGGHYLWCCNGADTPRYYDGSAWASVTITGITAANIISVTAHKNRLWFVLKDGTKAAYLPTGSIQGAATEFELGGVFSLGGTLVAIGTWSVDGGDGTDDLIVFVSSRGQVAIYAGTDPDNAATWALKGVFNLGTPIGARCLTRVGADLALISIDGVLPLSQSLLIERGAALRVSLTANIQPEMNKAARSAMSNFGWQLISYPRGTRAILNVPFVAGETQHQFVMNTVTGAWCRFTGQNANCWDVFQDRLFFGGNDGVVYEADKGGSDGGNALVADMKTAFSYYGKRGGLKRWTLCRPLLTTDGRISPAVGLNIDFRDDAAPVAGGASVTSAAKWDVAKWDVDVWPETELTQADWLGVVGEGYAASIRLKAQINSSSSVSPTLRVNGFDMLLEDGGYL